MRSAVLSGILFLILTVASIVQAHGVEQAGGEYCLSAGDIISVDVWGYDELKMKELRIRPDGFIAVPLVGSICAAGQSSEQLTTRISESLKRYLKNPLVTINIVRYHATRVYVLGEVNKPGLYEIEKQHNVLDALGLASGYTKYAAKKKILLIRKGLSKQEDVVNVDLLALLTKGDMKQNYELNDGDVLFVNSNGKISFNEDILPWITGAFEIKQAFYPESTVLQANPK